MHRRAIGMGLIVATIVGAIGVGLMGRVVQAQVASSTMDARLNQVIDILSKGRDCTARQTAIDEGMEILYGGLRPLPTPGDLQDETQTADQALKTAELKFAGALNEFAKGRDCGEAHGRALDLKLFIEQMNEVAQTVGQVTSECGQGADLGQPPCSELMPLIQPDGEPVVGQAAVIDIGFKAVLAGPHIPRWDRRWKEDVQTPDAIADGECSLVFKETRGLATGIEFKPLTVLGAPQLINLKPLQTGAPLWQINWRPAEYGKTWRFCKAEGEVTTTVTSTLRLDDALRFFWRWYE